MHSIDLDFFGARTRVFCQAQQDVDHLKYYYGDHSAAFVRPDISISFQTDAELSFFEHIRNEAVEKQLFVDTGEGAKLYEAFHLRAQRPTPLPPISFACGAPGLSLHHGASLLLPGKGAILIRGSSGAGKSVLLLSLLSRLKSHFVSDDMLVMDREGRIWPIFRPVGIRACALGMVSEEQTDLAHQALSISTASGTTHMVRPALLAPLADMRSHQVVLDVLLSYAADFKFSLTASSTHTSIRVGYDPAIHLRSLTDCIVAEHAAFARVAV